MTTPAPAYSIGDVVYLESSARIGFLESYKVSNIARVRNSWLYTIDVAQKPPAEPTVMAYVDLKQTRTLYFDERELISFESALLLVKASLERKLNEANRLLHKYFPDGTES
jgi:hypothetical protein